MKRVLEVTFGIKYGISSPTIVKFLYVNPAVEQLPAVGFRKFYVGSRTTIVIFIYLSPSVVRLLTKALEKYVVSSPAIFMFLFVAPEIERVLAVVIGIKYLYLFDSSYRHIFVRSPGI